MTKPDDMPQWAWDAAIDAAGPEHSFADVVERVAIALLEAERRGMERAAGIVLAQKRERSAARNVPLEQAAAAILSAAKEIEP